MADDAFHQMRHHAILIIADNDLFRENFRREACRRQTHAVILKSLRHGDVDEAIKSRYLIERIIIVAITVDI